MVFYQFEFKGKDTMCDEAAKVAADDAVPGGALAAIKLRTVNSSQWQLLG